MRTNIKHFYSFSSRFEVAFAESALSRELVLEDAKLSAIAVYLYTWLISMIHMTGIKVFQEV